MGCSDEVLDSRGNSGEGRLILSCISVESVVGDIQTRASLEQDVIPTAADFTLTIVEASTSQLVKTLQKGDTDCFLPVGSYKVRASYGDEAAMSEIPYFFGESQAVDIKEGESSTVEIQASLACAVIHPIVDPQLEAQYELYTITVMETSVGKSAEVGTLQNDKDFFVRGGTGRSYTLVMAGKNKLGDPVSYSWNYSDLVVRTRYKINCNPDLPAFTMPDQPEGNVWSKFIYINPMTADNISYKPEGLTDDEILSNIKYEVSSDGNTWIQAAKNGESWIAEGLTPSSSYKVRANFLEVFSSNPITVVTEADSPVPNGDFEDLRETINISSIQQGGRFRETYLGKWQTITSSYNVSEPKEWTSVNKKTCNDKAVNLNTWFVVPSTLNSSQSNSGSNAMALRNVAWDLSGKTPDDYTQTWGSLEGDIFNHNEPASIANRSAGKLFLGSYSYTDGAESYNEGIEFVSRPLTLKGYYKYVQDENDSNETGMVTVSLLNENTVIGTASKALTASAEFAEFELPIVYTHKSLRATKLRIMFTSSNHASYNQSEENLSIKTTNYNGRYESVSRGAMLTIDNLTFSYEYNTKN